MLIKLFKRSLPIWILGGGIAIIYIMVLTQPETGQVNPPAPVLKVDAVRLQPQNHRVIIESQGVVSARTESTLIPEVSGQVISVSPNFREGGFFHEGDVLLEIDPSDYLAAVTISEANLAEARLRLAEEEAAAQQAQEDWQRLGIGELPSNLVLREPQLALARANVAASEARVKQARRDLSKTKIMAPFEGRVLEQSVDVGQVVSPGTALAKIYAVDYAEIRLPLTTEEYAYLDLPPFVRGETAPELDNPVTLETRFGQETMTWEGRIVRVEGAVDIRSRQIYVVAQVDDPYGPDHPEPLKVGLFVEAKISGKSLDSVYVLPRVALREGAYILTIDEANSIRRKKIDPLWTSAEVVVFQDERIKPGTLVSLTQMTLAIDGMEVAPLIDGKPSNPGGMAENRSTASKPKG